MEKSIFDPVYSKLLSKGFLVEPFSVYKEISDHKGVFCSNDVSFDAKVDSNSASNLVLCGKGLNLSRSRVSFSGAGGNIVVLGAYSSVNGLDLRISGSGNIFYFGAFSTVGSITVLLTGQEGEIMIGDFCMLSNRIMVDRSDHHSIYDLETGKRINEDKNVYIENHVWIGRDVRVNKGSVVGQDSIVGQASIVSSEIPPNSLAAGVPARVIRPLVTWSRMKAASLDEMHSSDRDKAYLKKVEAYKNYLSSMDTVSLSVLNK